MVSNAKKIVLAVLLIIPLWCISQNFAPIGSIWHYTQNNPFNHPGITFTSFESVSDTVIDGKQCRKLLNVVRLDSDTLFATYKFFYSENDSVFFYEENEFHLLYDFGAIKGDTVVLEHFMTIDSSCLKMIIDSTGFININGIYKRIQYITCGDGVWVEFGNHVIEDIGSTYFMFPVYDGMWYGPLRCYQDSNIGLYLSTFHPDYGWNFQDCGEIITSIVEDRDNKYDIVVYPNPVSCNIVVENAHPSSKYRIYDIFGKLIAKGKIGYSGEIVFRDFRQGVYFLQVETEGRLVIKKIIRR